MSSSVFKKWTSAVLYLNEKIKNNRLIAGRNIQLENTGNGIRIHGSAENASGDTYNGYFKVTQTKPNKIKIFYGLDDSKAYAGKVNINYFPKDVSLIEFSISENCFIYLECELVGSPAATGASAKIKKSTTYPESEIGIYRDLISEVLVEDGKMTDFSQHNINCNILMGGDCTTDGDT